MQKLAYESLSPASVFYMESGESKQNDFSVRIFNQSQEIQFCGHGLLALAHALNKTPTISDAEISVFSPCHEFVLSLQDGNPWVGFEPLAIGKADINDIDMNAFSTPAMSAAKVDGSDGYLILEWPMSRKIRRTLTCVILHRNMVLTKILQRALLIAC